MVKEKKDKSYEKEYKEKFEEYKKGKNIGRKRISQLKRYKRKGKELGLPTGAYTEKLAKQRALQVGRKALITGIYTERTYERVGSAVSRALKKKILKKPSVKLERPVFTSKLLKSFSRTNYGVIKDIPQRVYAKEKRNLFFRG